jgi:hypothetical protein
MSIRAVDPVARSVLEIPLTAVKATKGLEDFTAKRTGRDLSICCLYQQGRCRADLGCRQIHADRDVVAHMRSNLANRHSCCKFCAGNYTPSGNVVQLSGRATAGMPAIPVERIVPTCGFVGQTDVPWSTVCRLHLQQTCKYGDSCRNVHICAKLGTPLLARAAMNVNASVPAAIVQHALAAMELVASPPSALVSTVTVQPALRMPAQLRAHFPRLNEESLSLPHPDLDGMTFAMPTLASVSSDHSHRCDIFGFSPLHTMAASRCSPSMCSP